MRGSLITDLGGMRAQPMKGRSVWTNGNRAKLLVIVYPNHVTQRRFSYSNAGTRDAARASLLPILFVGGKRVAAVVLVPAPYT